MPLGTTIGADEHVALEGRCHGALCFKAGLPPQGQTAEVKCSSALVPQKKAPGPICRTRRRKEGARKIVRNAQSAKFYPWTDAKKAPVWPSSVTQMPLAEVTHVVLTPSSAIRGRKIGLARLFCTRM